MGSRVGGRWPGWPDRLDDGPLGLIDLQLWGVSMGISKCLIDVEPYEACRVAGVVTKLVVDPVGGSIVATISDGTGEIAACWTIHRPTPELAVVPGRMVLLEGFCTLAEDGLPTLKEPTFHLMTGDGVA